MIPFSRFWHWLNGIPSTEMEEQIGMRKEERKRKDVFEECIGCPGTGIQWAADFMHLGFTSQQQPP